MLGGFRSGIHFIKLQGTSEITDIMPLGKLIREGLNMMTITINIPVYIYLKAFSVDNKSIYYSSFNPENPES